MSSHRRNRRTSLGRNRIELQDSDDDDFMTQLPTSRARLLPPQDRDDDNIVQPPPASRPRLLPPQDSDDDNIVQPPPASRARLLPSPYQIPTPPSSSPSPAPQPSPPPPQPDRSPPLPHMEITPDDTVHDTWNGAAGWSVYFHDELETDQACHGRSTVVTKLKDYFLTDHGQRTLSAIPENSFVFPLDYRQLSHSSSPSILRSIATAIQSHPDEALFSIGLAACRAAENLSVSSRTRNVFSDCQYLPVSRENRLLPRVYNYNPLSPLRSLKGNTVGKFVAVRGTVLRVSDIRQQLVSMEFECCRCSGRQLVRFVNYKYSVPKTCTATERCRSRSFAPLRDTVDSIDSQKIRIQELRDRDNEACIMEGGRMPRTVDVELFADVIETCIPGATVTVGGIVRVLPVEEGVGSHKRKAATAKCLYFLYVEANSVSTCRRRDENSCLFPASTMTIGRETATAAAADSETLAVHRVIREVVREQDPFGFLVHSLAPGIFGHEMVKAGLILALFGGTPKERVGPTGFESVPIRSDIHCLIVGDPGLGKSEGSGECGTARCVRLWKYDDHSWPHGNSGA